METLKPGRELDALVAEKVMRWSRGPAGWEFPEEGGRCLMAYESWSPSRDIGAAWAVVHRLRVVFENEPLVPGGKLRSFGHGFQLESCTENFPFGRWRCTFPYNCVSPPYEEMNDDAQAVGETAPHAICLAALKAVGA